jgi:SH3 domain-containing protein
MVTSPIPGYARLVPVALLTLAAAACGGSSQSSAPTSAPLATAPVGTAHASATASPGATPGLVLAPAGSQITVIAPLGLNMRSAPSTAAPVVGTLGQGATLTVMAHQTGWYSVMGATKQGFVTDNPQFISPRHFNSFQSSTHGFTLLYPDSWTFAETAAGVEFRPQNGPQVMTVRTAPTLDAIGPPGHAGYTVKSVDSTEVYGVTGVLRTLDAAPGTAASTSAPITGSGSSTSTGSSTGSATPAAPTVLPHLQQIRLSVKTTFAMQIDFAYNAAVDLAVFNDMVNSMVLPAANPAPPA